MPRDLDDALRMLEGLDPAFVDAESAGDHDLGAEPPRHHTDFLPPSSPPPDGPPQPRLFFSSDPATPLQTSSIAELQDCTIDAIFPQHRGPSPSFPFALAPELSSSSQLLSSPLGGHAPPEAPLAWSLPRPTGGYEDDFGPPDPVEQQSPLLSKSEGRGKGPLVTFTPEHAARQRGRLALGPVPARPTELATSLDNGHTRGSAQMPRATAPDVQTAAQVHKQQHDAMPSPAYRVPLEATRSPSSTQLPTDRVHHLQQPAQPQRQSPDDEDMFAADDDWIQTAMVEMDRIEGKAPEEIARHQMRLQEQQPAATLHHTQLTSAIAAVPPRTTSPYFANGDASGTAPSQAQAAEPLPPSRSASRSLVRFPKLPVSRGPSPLAATQTFQRPQPQGSSLRGQMVQKQRHAIPAPLANPTGAELVSVYALDTQEERNMFSFTHFNAMQSAVFQAAYNSDENLVVSAPTGSGKTTVFELAFLHMLKYRTDGSRPLAIYMAPTKALCSERARDWTNRLRPLGISCVEVTGDTADYRQAYDALKKADLLITTPEKWDSLTRRSTMMSVVERLDLMMIDEVHLLHEERGATLEVVVARMKSSNCVRFVAVSASVPNIDDVARWIGEKGATPNFDNGVNAMSKATVFKFGEEYRPVPLKRFTYGFDAFNEFALGSKLDKEIFPLLNRYSEGKPVLIFCPTRKACMKTAEQIMKEYKAALEARRLLPWDAARNSKLVLKDSKVQELTEYGIAIHHAGMDLLDRREIESAFCDTRLHLLVSTSTLAVGVNLPAHLVIIKGTSCWQGQGFREYSDIDIQQMMGRAGRPQFDQSGTVVVLCEKSKVPKYQDILSAKMILESRLHEFLTEHINSEIGLGTIKSVPSAVQWLKSSFLYIRIQQNPRHYQAALNKERTKTWSETIASFIEKAIADLEENEFVRCEDEEDEELAQEKHGLEWTNLGKIMSQNVVSYKTMCHIITLDANASLCQLLEILAGSTEFEAQRIRQGEQALLNKLRSSPEIRYQLEEVKTYADKVFLHLQVTFGNVSLADYTVKTENSSPLQTMMAIYQVAPRIAKAILQVASEKKYGGATRSALELVRTVNGKAWENSPTIFRQIDKIGPKSIVVLASNGISTWDQLISVDPGRLAMWLNRNPSFGYEIVEQARTLPRFQVSMSEEGRDRDEHGFPIITLRVVLTANKELGKKKLGKSKYKDKLSLTVLFISSRDNRFIDLRTIDTRKLSARTSEYLVDVTLYHPEEKIIGIAGVEEKAGLATTVEYEPGLPQDLFPEDNQFANIDEDQEEDSSAVPSATTKKAASTKLARSSTAKTAQPAKRIGLSMRPFPVGDSEAEDELLDDEDTSPAPVPKKVTKKTTTSKAGGSRQQATVPKVSTKKRPEKIALPLDSEGEDELIDLTTQRKLVGSTAEKAQSPSPPPSPGPSTAKAKGKQPQTATSSNSQPRKTRKKRQAPSPVPSPVPSPRPAQRATGKRITQGALSSPLVALPPTPPPSKKRKLVKSGVKRPAAAASPSPPRTPPKRAKTASIPLGERCRSNTEEDDGSDGIVWGDGAYLLELRSMVSSPPAASPPIEPHDRDLADTGAVSQPAVAQDEVLVDDDSEDDLITQLFGRPSAPPAEPPHHSDFGVMKTTAAVRKEDPPPQVQDNDMDVDDLVGLVERFASPHTPPTACAGSLGGSVEPPITAEPNVHTEMDVETSPAFSPPMAGQVIRTTESPVPCASNELQVPPIRYLPSRDANISPGWPSLPPTRLPSQLSPSSPVQPTRAPKWATSPRVSAKSNASAALPTPATSSASRDLPPASSGRQAPKWKTSSQPEPRVPARPAQTTVPQAQDDTDDWFESMLGLDG